MLCVVNETKDTSCAGGALSPVGGDDGAAEVVGRLSSALSSLCGQQY